MNTKTAAAIGFVVGGVTGFVGASKMLNRHYAKIAQMEIDSVKATFKKRRITVENPERAEESKSLSEAKPNLESYVDYTSRFKYDTVNNESVADETIVTANDAPGIDQPYVISPDEYGEKEDYEEIELTFYSDDIIADDDDREMSQEEIRNAIGPNSVKSHFGEYEEDMVYIRNDRRKTDYAIILSEETYAEVLMEKPWLKNN